jgi:ribosomal protein L11 methylase PrmA
MPRNAFLGLIDSLESTVRGLAWSPGRTEWADYEQSHTYTPAALEQKRRLIEGFLQRIRPSMTWDLGANVGTFSRLAAEAGSTTIAFDLDPSAVELHYRRCRAEGEKRVLPLLLDLTNPSPAQGWNHRERMSLAERGPADAVMALAFIHHLAIANNVPLPLAAETLAGYGKSLIIEFVPKTDSQVQRLLASRQDIFPGYTLEGFEREFRQTHTIRASERIEGSERILFWMERL